VLFAPEREAAVAASSGLHLDARSVMEHRAQERSLRGVASVRVLVVADVVAADIACSVLRAEGINSSSRQLESTEAAVLAFHHEILVAQEDAEWARELLNETDG